MGNMKNIDVLILMGSKSDEPMMEPCYHLLDDYNISYETKIASAHRTPWNVIFETFLIQERGIKVVIAAAGKAAALPGTVAAFTTIPVIGIPIDSGHLGGQDALFAISQMPSGVPVATVGINESANAGYLALQILGLNDSKISQKLQNEKYKREVYLQSKNQDDLSFEDKRQIIIDKLSKLGE